MHSAGHITSDNPTLAVASDPASTASVPRPTISVIMTVYNGKRFVEEAIQSVLNQTYSDFEFVIVDDGSTDGTEQILAKFQERDARLRVIHQKNQGIAAAMNRALELSQHHLVAHIDHDDRALPEWLERQLAFYSANQDCSVVSSHGYFINTSGRRFGKSDNPVDVEKGMRELNPACFLELIHSTVLMRRDDILSIGGYRAIMPEDRDLWGRVVTAGMMIRCNPVPLVEYRLHGQSMTTRKTDPIQTYARRGVDLNIVRRMKGEPELTPLEVREFYENQPLTQKWREYRRVTAGANFRLAARHYSEGQWFHLFHRLAIALAMRPMYVVSRGRRKLSAS